MGSRTIWVRGLIPSYKGSLIEWPADEPDHYWTGTLLSFEHFDTTTVVVLRDPADEIQEFDLPHRTEVQVFF